jgi:DNA-binding NarL/FixJ family response regulator
MKTKIALVDDHYLFRKGVKAVIDGIEDVEVVLEAGTGEELLENYFDGTAHLIMLDMEMPGMNGYSTMLEIRKIDQDVKVMFLTIHKEQQLILKCMEDGANGFLQKDAHPEEMKLAILKLIKTGYYFSDHVSQTMLDGLSEWKNGDREALIEFSDKELEVLNFICSEHTTVEIAEKMFLSPRTIEGYREALMEKTGSRNIAGLVVYAVCNQLVQF